MTTLVRAAFQPVEEQLREQERREVVHGESALQPVGGDVSAIPTAARVVDEDVDLERAVVVGGLFLEGGDEGLGTLDGAQVGLHRERADAVLGRELLGQLFRDGS